MFSMKAKRFGTLIIICYVKHENKSRKIICLIFGSNVTFNLNQNGPTFLDIIMAAGKYLDSNKEGLNPHEDKK